MKAHIYKEPEPPDNRTEEQKVIDREKARKALADFSWFSSFFKDSPYSKLK